MTKSISISVRTFVLALGGLMLLCALIPQSLFAAVTVYETQSKRDYYVKVQPDMRANGGIDETAAHGYPQYQVNQVSPSGQRICYLYDPTAYPTTWSLGGFNSPGNNRMAAWDPAQNKWIARSAGTFGNKRYNYITCKTDAKADTSLTANGASEVTINQGESVNLSWYSQYGAIRKAACTATNFSTSVTVPASTQTVVSNNDCGGINGIFGFNVVQFFEDSGSQCGNTTFGQVSVPASTSQQPFSGSRAVTPTQTTTYTYSCTNANGTNTSSVTVNVVQPDVEPIAVSCSPSPSSGVTNEPITWSSQILNHDGPFTYEWQGSDGLTGNTASVRKTYTNPGTKTARLKVTFTPEAGETPPTPVIPTSTCLPANSEVPAGYLCSAGGYETLPWGQCCSGVAALRCPAPNEPAEAWCTGRADTGGGTNTTSVSGAGQWTLVGSDISDLACGSGGRRSPANQTNVRANMPDCSSEDPSGEACTTVGSRCKWNSWSGATCNVVSAIFRCAATQSTTPTPVTPTPTAAGFSITTDCDGTVCTNRTCTADPGGSSGTTPSNPNATPNDPSAPTWGVTINLPGQCLNTSMCVGADVYNQGLDCSREFVRTCPFGCMSGQCVAPRPEIDLSISPAGVRSGESCTISVAARHVARCTISGQGISQVLTPNASGVVPSQSFSTPGMTNTSDYTVSCESPRGSVTESVRCTLLPVFRET
ncbi:PKD domain-containing protein [Patescibacteria group bacterium]|nr:PKD domain-containing protein [Patescibacteria group bacterium]